MVVEKKSIFDKTTLEILEKDQRIFNHGGPKHRLMQEQVSLYLTNRMFNAMKKVVENGRFPNRSEFIRFVVGKWLDENKEWW